MKVIANRQLHGVYGTMLAGEEFDVDHSLGLKLLARKLVSTPDTYVLKALRPSSTLPAIENGEPRLANKKR